jgi:hypothetical protein
MPVSAYNTNPALNTAISGIDIAENSAAAGYNNALRQIMADIKAWTDAYAITLPLAVASGGTGSTTAAAALTALGAFPAAGGAITGPTTVNGTLSQTSHGVFPWFASTSMTGGRIFVQALGADPTGQPGDIVLEY